MRQVQAVLASFGFLNSSFETSIEVSGYVFTDYLGRCATFHPKCAAIDFGNHTAM
jgi:hypothetical protein